MTSLESYFDLTLLRQHETLPEKSSNWLLREINRPTNQLELSRWALNWKRGGDRSIEIERARNFPCISWPERPSGSVSSRFEILSEQIFFVVMNCSSQQRREVWALNRAIFRNWARRDFSFSAAQLSVSRTCLWLCVTHCTHILQAINHFVQRCNAYCGALTFHLKLSSRSVARYNRVGRGGGQCSSALCTGSRKIGHRTIAMHCRYSRF